MSKKDEESVMRILNKLNEAESDLEYIYSKLDEMGMLWGDDYYQSCPFSTIEAFDNLCEKYGYQEEKIKRKTKRIEELEVFLKGKKKKITKLGIEYNALAKKYDELNQIVHHKNSNEDKE